MLVFTWERRKTVGPAAYLKFRERTFNWNTAILRVTLGDLSEFSKERKVYEAPIVDVYINNDKAFDNIKLNVLYIHYLYWATWKRMWWNVTEDIWRLIALYDNFMING